jgi:hypothetical protein
VKVKLATGNYRLQTNRASFNQLEIDPICQLCGTAPETVVHFVLHCPALQQVRCDPLHELCSSLQQYNPAGAYVGTDSQIVPIIIDSSCIVRNSTLLASDKSAIKAIYPHYVF